MILIDINAARRNMGLPRHKHGFRMWGKRPIFDFLLQNTVYVFECQGCAECFYVDAISLKDALTGFDKRPLWLHTRIIPHSDGNTYRVNYVD